MYFCLIISAATYRKPRSETAVEIRRVRNHNKGALAKFYKGCYPKIAQGCRKRKGNGERTMNNTKSVLGGRILDQLAAINKSQKELANEVGITEVSLSRYIAGSRTPRGPIIANIARALHTTTDYLLGEDSEKSFEKEYQTTMAWIARNAKKMNSEQRMTLVSPLFQLQEG